MKFVAYARVVLAALTILSSTGTAAAGSPVETYADQTIQKGLALLNDATLTGKARDTALRDFLKATLDIKRIALFTLGDTAKNVSPGDVSAYTKAFEDFTLANYVSRVGAYGGQSLKISGTTERAPGDFIVTVTVVDPHASQSGPPGTAQFRILKENDGNFAVVDASVEGVWFEVAQRADIQGFLEQNDGSIPKLIDHLSAMTVQISSAP